MTQNDPTGYAINDVDERLWSELTGPEAPETGKKREVTR
jgi:hypothetical protein